MDHHLGERHIEPFGHSAQAQAVPADLFGQVQRRVDDAPFQRGLGGAPLRALGFLRFAFGHAGLPLDTLSQHPAARLHVDEQALRVFDVVLDSDQEGDRFAPVDDAVVVAER